MVKHIYLVRHGETEANRLWVHQVLSTDLTRKGVQQAFAAARFLGNLHIDVLIASDAARTQTTASIVAVATHRKMEADSRFRELRRSSLVEGTHYLGWRSMWGSFLLFIHSENPHWHYHNGENFTEFRARAKEALDYLSKLPGEYIIVVTHRGFISAMAFGVRHGFDGPIAEFAAEIAFTHLANGSITELTYDPERVHSWQVERVGISRHLRTV